LPEEPGVELQSAAVVDAATLPPFTNQRGCARCGARYEIRVHFDRDCELVRGDHFHRVCSCGHRWLERCSEGLERFGHPLQELDRAAQLVLWPEPPAGAA